MCKPPRSLFLCRHLCLAFICTASKKGSLCSDQLVEASQSESLDARQIPIYDHSTFLSLASSHFDTVERTKSCALGSHYSTLFSCISFLRLSFCLSFQYQHRPLTSSITTFVTLLVPTLKKATVSTLTIVSLPLTLTITHREL